MIILKEGIDEASEHRQTWLTYMSGLNLGQNRTVECLVTGARPAPTIIWFRNQREIRDAAATTAVSLNGGFSL